ncbi:MAG: hypothetical protein KAS17_12630, partial [Victivallaceae bacterium]|nr:hypothetical protein [Victivallaceae bacterium]
METVYPVVALLFGLFLGVLIHYFVSMERNKRLAKQESTIAERDEQIRTLTENKVRLEEQQKQNDERLKELTQVKKSMTAE